MPSSSMEEYKYYGNPNKLIFDQFKIFIYMVDLFLKQYDSILMVSQTSNKYR